MAEFKLVNWNNPRRETRLVINQYTTQRDIEEKAISGSHSLIDQAEALRAEENNSFTEKPQDDARYDYAEWPIYLVDAHKDPQDAPARHIGYVKVTLIDSEFIIDHLTLDYERIDSDWSATKFYSGGFGLKDC